MYSIPKSFSTQVVAVTYDGFSNCSGKIWYASSSAPSFPASFPPTWSCVVYNNRRHCTKGPLFTLILLLGSKPAPSSQADPLTNRTINLRLEKENGYVGTKEETISTWNRRDKEGISGLGEQHQDNWWKTSSSPSPAFFVVQSSD